MSYRIKDEAQHILDQVETIRNGWGVNTDYNDIAPQLEAIESSARRIHSRIWSIEEAAKGGHKPA